MDRQTPEEIWNTEFFQTHVHRALDAVLKDFETEMVTEFALQVEQCESPLEAAFATWWRAISRMRRWSLGLLYQQEAQLSAEVFRLDCVIAPFSGGVYSVLSEPDRPRIAVELDGHVFHERTKAQVELRNRRDRLLGRHGWTVLHFSGSEFHKDPIRVVEEIHQVAEEQFTNAMVKAEHWPPLRNRD